MFRTECMVARWQLTASISADVPENVGALACLHVCPLCLTPLQPGRILHHRDVLVRHAPRLRFAVAEREGKVVIDPATFERYTWITGVFSSLDATGTVELYADLEPLFDEAYGEIGYPGGRFQNALDDALGVLASTPLPEGYVEVRRGNVLWEFSDAELENLSPPQKHLLRMGPANVRLIQSKIREIQAAFSH